MSLHGWSEWKEVVVMGRQKLADRKPMAAKLMSVMEELLVEEQKNEIKTKKKEMYFGVNEPGSEGGEPG